MKKIKQNYIDNADFIICISKNTQKDLIEIYNYSKIKNYLNKHYTKYFHQKFKIQNN